MPFIINLQPSNSWYLHSLAIRNGTPAVGGSGGCRENALRFDSFDLARALVQGMRGWPDARVEEVGAPTVPLPMPAHFTRILTRAHAHRLAIVYATLAEHAARDCRERVVSGLSPDESIDDAVAALRDQSNTIQIANALVSLVETDPTCAVTTDRVDIDEVVCDYCDGTLRIGAYRSAQFSRLMAATEQPLPLGELLHLAAPSHHP